VDDSIADGNRIVTMEEYYDVGTKGLVEALPKDAKVYVSLDIDVLDMSLIPGCVSGEPNGMAYKEMRDTLWAWRSTPRSSGFRPGRVNPQLDVGTGITSYLARTASSSSSAASATSRAGRARATIAPKSASRRAGLAELPVGRPRPARPDRRAYQR